MASKNDSVASIANECDESLRSEHGDAPHSPETDDDNEMDSSHVGTLFHHK